MIQRATTAALAAILLVGLSACASTGEPRSTTSAAAVDVQTTVYHEVDGKKLDADVCLPRNAHKDRAAMILVHGGGFTEGSRSSMRKLCEQFAQRGVVGVAIDYRMLPDFAYPAPVDDANSAVAWLKQPDIAAQYAIDPARIGMLGSSAGAIITASVATEPDTGIAAGVALSPVADMTPSGLTLGTPSPEAIATILAYLGCTKIDDCPQSVPASPLKAVSKGDAPLFLAGGSRELVPRQQVKALHDALQAAGVPTELTVLAGERHGLALLTDKMRNAIFDFVKARLQS
ncbi:alpha/beta hydrolase [Microbacterium deminutum]|uniref:Alpha/beta hydrolase fold-3 domain-containing protein n=1 Tax=Microbacterium deminutum TaxID=344164 RepID=A0ABN2Q4S9_9MICO